MRCLIITGVSVLAVVGCLLLNLALPGVSHAFAIGNTPAASSRSAKQPPPPPPQQNQQQQQAESKQSQQAPSQQRPAHQQHKQQQQQSVDLQKLKRSRLKESVRYLQAAPEYKLLWCSMSKVGSTSVAGTINNLRASLPSTPPDVQRFLRTGHWSDRLRALLPPTASQRSLRYVRSYWGRSTVGSPAVNLTAADASALLLADDSWTKVLFVREPVERFLSAFVSKCQPGHDPVGNCVLANKTHPYISFATLMERARALFAAQQLDKALFLTNYHWSPQARFCGGLAPDRNLPHYNAVYRYSSSTFATDTADALLRAGVEPSLVEAVLSQALKDGGGAARGYIGHVTGAGNKLCQYFRSVEEVEEVAGWYREDYEAFGEVLAQQPSAVEQYKTMCGL